MQSRTTCEVLDVRSSVQLELVNDVERVVLYYIEVAVVAVARYEIAVLTVPLGMLNAHILGRNHLTVEHNLLRTILLVVLLYESKHFLYKVQIVGIVVDLKSHELCGFNKSVHTDCEILTTHIDISSVKQRQHTLLLQILKILVVCQLHLMAEINNLRKVFGIVKTVLYGILYATVEVDGEYALRTSRHATGTECIAEAVVLDFVAQAAA